MSSEEEDFARLLYPLDDALAMEKNIANNLPDSPPSYQNFHTSGRHTPNEMAAYKKAVQNYEKLKTDYRESKNKIRDASVALDSWIPAPMHERLNMGVAIYAPVSGGVYALFKEEGTYRIIKGTSEDDAGQKYADYLAMPK